MLRTQLIHPGILGALGEAGHGSTILISDGNFPHGTMPHPSAHRVYLNLAPGRLLVTDVLEVLATAIPIEAVALMESGLPEPPEAHAAIRALVPEGVPVELVERFAFYDRTRAPGLALVVATGDQRLYANVLLTIGVVG
jgi:L-fucose mutarotase